MVPTATINYIIMALNTKYFLVPFYRFHRTIIKINKLRMKIWKLTLRLLSKVPDMQWVLIIRAFTPCKKIIIIDMKGFNIYSGFQRLD